MELKVLKLQIFLEFFQELKQFGGLLTGKGSKRKDSNNAKQHISMQVFDSALGAMQKYVTSAEGLKKKLFGTKVQNHFKQPPSFRQDSKI